MNVKRSKKGVSIIDYGIRKYDDLNKVLNKSFTDIMKSEKSTDKYISCVVDSQLCSFNEIFVEKGDTLDFHNQLSGKDALLDYFDSYYYPIGSRDDQFIGVHIDSSIKKRILNSIEKKEGKLNFLGVGIFSAENLARDVFNAKSLDNYLIVRFIQSNKIELLFINDGLLSVYAQCRLSDNLIKPSLLLGDSECKHKVLDALRDALFKSKNKNTYLQKIYLYQSQGQSPLIKNIIKSNSDELVLLNAFNYNSSESYSPKLSEIFNHISYAELGNMFRGINV